jgi:uncharacterized membrane protein
MRLSFPWPRVALIGILWAWCLFLEWLRTRYTPLPFSANLNWNLLLATIPLLCSVAMQWATRRNRNMLNAVLSGLWILFLPNAPYILTDFLHLGSRPDLPLWLDLAMISAFAGTGLIFCYVSLSEVQALVEQKHGPKVGWAVACGSLLLCASGIYLGRYLRLNSWNVITHPSRVIYKSVHWIGIDQTLPGILEVTLVYGIGLIVGYLALHLFVAAVRGTK